MTTCSSVREARRGPGLATVLPTLFYRFGSRSTAILRDNTRWHATLGKTHWIVADSRIMDYQLFERHLPVRETQEERELLRLDLETYPEFWRWPWRGQGTSHYTVVSTKNSTTTERAYRIEKQRLLVGTCQVVPNPTGPDTGDAS